MKILIAVDGSEYTQRAVEYVALHLNFFNSPELHLLHVKTPIPVGRIRGMLGHDELESYYRDESQAALAPSEQMLRDKGIPFQSNYRVGDIADELQDYVQQNQIDLVVMGSHGHRALQNLVMGSTTSKVLAGSNIPVLVVR